jgi:hypothetical protein|tara:strand:- start:168 stop:629 length:462 start_codon:yes stop_codon:yes gene_type:complete
MDNDFIECPCCGHDACTKNISNSGIEVQLCWTCGMTTNDKLIDGGDFEKDSYELTAEIIKDLKQTHKGLSWYPKIINLPKRGMVFPEWNKRVKDWYWAAVKAIPVTEEEKEKYPDPLNKGQFYKFRMDMKNIKRYNKLCFMDAAEEIGMFNEE